MHNRYHRQMTRYPLGFLALLVSSFATATEESIPKHAERMTIAPNVIVHHWTVPSSSGNERDIRGVVRVAEWPRGSWGAEITMTPIPDCCGAHPRTTRWRKSEPETIRYLGTVDAGAKYQLSLRFK